MPAFYQLEFEKPVVEIERKIATLQDRLKKATSPAAAAPAADRVSGATEAGIEGSGLGPSLEGEPATSESDTPADPESLRREISDLEIKRERKLVSVYSHLSPWDTVRVARHPNRPQTRDYIDLIFKDFTELHGDRRFGDDPAMIVGFARLGGGGSADVRTAEPDNDQSPKSPPPRPIKCLVVGHQKGRTTQEKIACHFGCAHPEGYRKALAKMKLAEKFGLPIITFVDTPGAYPGIGAEARGQAEAIAVNLRDMSRLKVPIVSVVIGEGGSGGALGIAVADRVAMLSNSWYSVISPEGCAAILWKTANEQTNTAAAIALKLTARDNLALGIIDAVIPEPTGGAHREPRKTAAAIERWLVDQILDLKSQPPVTLPKTRYERFRKLGSYSEPQPA